MTVIDAAKKMWLGLALIAMPFLVLVGLETYVGMSHLPALQKGRGIIVHAFEVITTAQALDRSIQDAERGQRGYLISGDASYLQPFRTGVRDAPILFAKLSQLTADSPEQRRRLQDLGQKIEVKLAELQKTMETYDREGIDAARLAVRTDIGLVAMRAINESIDTIIAEENTELDGQLEQIAAAERRANTTVLISAALAVAIIVFGVVIGLLVVRKLKNVERAGSESERHFKLLVAAVRDCAIYMLDPEGYIASWNAGAEHIKGYSADEIIGKHFSIFYTVEDRNADVPRKALQAALECGKYEAEAWRVRKDGSRFFASVLIDPVLDHGRLVGFAKVTRDVTERRKQQIALDEAKADLAQAQKMDALGQLSGGVAHDFNNLLAVMRNCVDILQRRLQDADPDVREALELIRRNTDRAASLTQRLLTFSRRQRLDPRPVDSNGLVTGMADLLRRALGENIALELALDAELWPVSADPNQLEMAILNLAVNARDAMRTGGTLTIETANIGLDDTYAVGNEQAMRGHYVMIAVSDTGTGMTKEVLAKAFEPFFTTKELGQGTGLGLSQVYGFIKQSGGHVKIDSQLGEGTSVKLYLPRLVGVELMSDRLQGASSGMVDPA